MHQGVESRERLCNEDICLYDTCSYHRSVFKEYIERIFGSGLLVVGICLIITALLLTFSYFAKPRQRDNISYGHAFIIGLAQAVAVLPGLSRSGTTIATGLLLGNKKEQVAQFSFLMVLIPILGEAFLSLLDF